MKAPSKPASIRYSGQLLFKDANAPSLGGCVDAAIGGTGFSARFNASATWICSMLFMESAWCDSGGGQEVTKKALVRKLLPPPSRRSMNVIMLCSMTTSSITGIGRRFTELVRAGEEIFEQIKDSPHCPTNHRPACVSWLFSVTNLLEISTPAESRYQMQVRGLLPEADAAIFRDRVATILGILKSAFCGVVSRHDELARA